MSLGGSGVSIGGVKIVRVLNALANSIFLLASFLVISFGFSYYFVIHPENFFRISS